MWQSCRDVGEIVKEVEMVHLGRQCERIEHSCPFGSLYENRRRENLLDMEK